MYAWKEGSRHKVKADVAGSVCEQLEKKGQLTAKRLLEVSKPKDAPLHTEFEWDDAKAAEGFREQQARLIINNLTVTISKQEAEPVRAFFNIDRTENNYTATLSIIKNQDSYKALLQQAIRELNDFQRKYNSLNELAPVFRTIKQIKEASYEASDN